MEKRFVLFILICAIIIPLYYKFVMPPPPVHVPQNPSTTSGGTGEPGTVGNGAAGNGAGNGAAGPSASNSGSPTAGNGAGVTAPGVGQQPSAEKDPASAGAPQFESRTVRLTNPVLDIEVTTLGAAVQTVELFDYRESERDQILSLISEELQSGLAFTLTLPGRQITAPLESVHWELVSEVPGEKVVFRYPIGEGRSVQKEYVLPREGYELEVAVTFEGEFPAATDVPYRLLGPERIRFETNAHRPNARVAGTRNPRGGYGGTEHEKVGELPQSDGVRLDVRGYVWAGLESNYFACVIRPTEIAAGNVGKMVEIADSDSSRAGEYRGWHKAGRQEYPYQVGFQQPISAGETDRFRIFLGPKEPKVLEAYEEYGYSGLIDYGMLGLLVRLFLFLLRTFESLIGSWGIAIILLTVVVKAVLHPMNKKNQRAMQRQQKKMAKIQPEMKALREKHKSDPLKANQEIQKLFREHGVNPAQMAGGCLMLFMQLPIWIGLISTFRLAIELRQASFLYISDLTEPDRLAELPFSLPFLGEWFNLLPILYVIVTLINQKMMPKSDDPQMRQQQKMMSFMMIAFGFIFYNFASGLLLYFLTSASLGIIEQKMIRAELNREEEEEGDVVVKGPAAPPPPKPGQQVKRRS